MKIDISIIIPVYNGATNLEETLNSILSQTFPSFEVILINDGSTDKSQEIMTKYSKIDKRIVVYTQENSGVSKTRNRGIDLASGEYICFIDADDLIEKNYLSELFALVDENKADFSITGYDIFYKSPNESEKSYVPNFPYSDKNLSSVFRHNLFNYLLSIGVGVNLWNKLFQKSFIDKYKIRFNEYQSFDEDMFFVWKCCLLAKKVYFDNSRRYFYRQSNSSAIMNYHPDIFKQYDKALEEFRIFAKKNNSYTAQLEYEIVEVYASKLPVFVTMVSKSPFKFETKRGILEDNLKKSQIIHNDNLETYKDKGILYKLASQERYGLLVITGELIFRKMKFARVIKRLIQ